MSDHDTPDVPPATADESAALALLDARGRRAAANLRSEIDSLVGERPDAGTVTVGTAPGRARTWLVAAVVVVVAGLVAALVLVTRSGDEDAVVSNDVPAYLLAGSLPDGWQVQGVQRLRLSDLPSAGEGGVTVYGDATLDDPWEGSTLAVLRMPEDLQDGEPGESGAEAIEVGGRPATITRAADVVSVRVPLDDQVVSVSGREVEREVVLAVAEAAVAGDPTTALPDGFAEVASGPLTAAGMASGYAVDGLAVIYGGATSEEQLVLVQRAGDADDAELLRLLGRGVEATEVRGQPAFYVEDYMLQWYEASSGLLVTVLGEGQDRDGFVRFAEGLRSSRPGEVDDLVQAHGGSGPLGPPAPGEVVVAEGEYPAGGPWRLVAADDGSAGFGLTFADTAGSTGIGVPKDGGWGVLDVDVAAHGEGGASDVVAVYGAVAPEVASVALEAPGRTPVPLGLHVVEGIAGWDEKVFVGLVPVDSGQAQLVARDAAGAEVAREPLDPSTGSGSDAGSAGSAGSGQGSTTESCVTLPDGGEECSATSSGSAAGGG